MAKEIFLKEDINRTMKQNREMEYRNTTDALFFKAQRGEIEMNEWIDAVNAVKAKFPYVDEDLVMDIPYPHEPSPSTESQE